MRSSAPVYLDYQATTPLDPRVHRAMLPFLAEDFGNPHSMGHSYGWRAADAVRDARARVADFIHANDDEVVFTSGATESCNLAIRGVAREARKSKSERRRIITLTTEHPAVLETVADLADCGWDSTFLPVDGEGLVDLNRLEEALVTPTLLVSVMAANNEIGVVQPIADIAARCRRAGALLHTDATQAAGRMRIDVDAWGVDLLSLSAHKVYGPKGVGALFVREGTPIAPLMTGGGQERSLRPGTIPAPWVVGFGTACEVADSEVDEDARRMADLADGLVRGLRRAGADLRLFGHPTRRIAGSLSLGLSGVQADVLVREAAPQIAIATGSACAPATARPSHVLLALGLDAEEADTAVRVSLGRFTSKADIDTATQVLRGIVREWAPRVV